MRKLFLSILTDTSKLYALKVSDYKHYTQTDSLIVQRFPEPFAGFDFTKIELTMLPKPYSLINTNVRIA
ncbi:MAG: hypothetical protein EXR21_04130 [Flavobacteriaceae bacterium]|nr:hypothetical protein [Flavobacteriaceae bacterium]